LTGSVRRIFGGQFTDMLSGYRVFSRRFVKSFPALASGFEIETELTVHALELRMPCGEADTVYGSRPEESESKLSTYRDGFRILKTIVRLYMVERPLQFFSIFSLALALAAIGFAIPLLPEYLETGLVPRLPTALLATGLMLSALLSFLAGLLLDNVTRGRQELKRMSYLSIPGVSHTRHQ
ncbi:MAG: glycosyl transferase, partial [Lysobacterales bacterium]